MYDTLRRELDQFYKEELPARVEALRRRVFAALDEYDAAHPGLNSYQLKAKQYEVIAREIEPVFLEEMPFFYETGGMAAYGNGLYKRGADHANGWLWLRNQHLFEEADPERYALFRRNRASILYLSCGPFVDLEHFGLPMGKIFRKGLKGIYEEIEGAAAETGEERDFLACAKSGIEALHTVAGKFAAAARERGLHTTAAAAERVPWERPETFFEGLCVLAFLRKALGTIEGVGYHSFGRPDVLLKELYERDLARGVPEEELYDMVCRFLLIWDSALDRRKPMEKYAEYEYECSLTLGGCDREGAPVWNGVTRLFLRAQRELCTLYPKMMLRFSADAPREYLEEATRALLEGRSLSLFQSDERIIPALVRSGRVLEDARNYIVGGCWDAIVPDGGKSNGGEYLNLLRPLEWAIHQPEREMEENQMVFAPLEDCGDFEPLYARFLQDAERLMMHKAMMVAEGALLWPKVAPLGVTSALTEGCLEKRRDLTAGGGKYNWDRMYFSAFPDVVDSLLAINSLCFEQKVCSLPALLEACRQNWPDEALRQRAIAAPSYGDGSEASARLAGRLSRDLYAISRRLPTPYGGGYQMGLNMYTEIIWWGQKMAATPNGRRNGDYLSHGLTPSRLQKTPTAQEALSGLREMDLRNFGGNSVMNFVLPAGKIRGEQLIAFLRAAARAGAQALQINCVCKEELLAAQRDPEGHRDIIVRVCGFSAPFVSLSPTYQQEFLSRNFHGVD